MSYSTHAETIEAQLRLSPEFARLRAVRGEIDLGDDLLAAILEAAATFAEERIAPFNRVADQSGCLVADNRVVLAPGQNELWQAFGADGWMSLDVPVQFGGQGLPLVLLSATQELFDRACVAFGMEAGSARAAARLIEAHGDPALQALWLPKIASGVWTATICISEAEAGSDVGRIRTKATPDGAGGWRITGEKMWISFGDHQSVERIGHCLLARTPDGDVGTRGLSLFFVPTVVDTSDGPRRNGVHTRRIEDKMGMNGSPTCVLGFENAAATMIGQPGRGLALLFRMIIAMRLSVGVQGLGVASGAAAIAHAYAAERRQGGSAGAPAVAISEHWDVRRMLAEMAARVQTLRGLVIATAATADLADHAPDDEERSKAAALLQWLLPIVKTSGADTAFAVAGQAMQVLGGAGYTRDWPVEQMLRDSRVLAIYEGTSGIQALDLLKRRLLADDAGYRQFVAVAQQDLQGADGETAAVFRDALFQFSQVVTWLKAPARSSVDHDCAASAFLSLAILIAHAWIALRLSKVEPDGIGADLRFSGRYFLRTLAPELARWCGAVMDETRPI